MHKKYTFKDGKRYGPYLYETKRENGKIVTTYLGHSPNSPVNSEEKRKRTQNIFYSLLFGVLLLAVIFSFFYLPSILTGKVSLDVKSSYNPGETITGNLKLNLAAGELIPADSNVIVSLTGISKAFKLSDLIPSSTSEGNFYAIDSDISGHGIGYGVVGHKEIYPEVSFELIISGSSDSDNDSADNSTDQALNDNSSISSDGSESGEASSDNSNSDTAQESSNTDGSNSDSTDSGSSESSEGGITGSVISDSENKISGKTSKGNNFEYVLNDGESVSLVADSVEIDGEKADSSLVNVVTENGKVIVSTDYSTTEEGFGSEYSEGDGETLQIDLEEFGFVAENDSLLVVDVNYNGKNIVKVEKDISVNDVIVEETNITNETLVNETLNVSVNTTQFKAVLGQPVKWVKTFDADGLAKVSVELPISAENITVRKIAKEITDSVQEENNSIDTPEIPVEENNSEIIEKNVSDATIDINGNVISGRVTAEINSGKKSGFGNWIKKTFKFTGLAVTDEENETQELVVQVGTNDESVEIEYYTEAPLSSEEELADRKIVHVTSPGDVHYEDVLIFTNLSESLKISDPGSVQIFWAENNTYLPVYNVVDSDENGLYDYVEWIAPHLSNQTFEIIVITHAQHLDDNRTFVSDIFDSVRELDGNWSEEIPAGHYVRVTFAKNLTPVNDITVYPRVISGNPQIKIYQINGQDEVASFDSLNDDQYNKVYLTNLGNAQDTFDLQVLGGSVEFDHIIDPPATTILVPSGNASQPTVSGALTEITYTFSTMTEILAACYRKVNVSAGSVCLENEGTGALDPYFLWNVTLPNYTTVNSIFLTSISSQATANGTDNMTLGLYNFTSGAYVTVNWTKSPGNIGVNATLTYNITGTGLVANFLSGGIVRFMTRTFGNSASATDIQVDFMSADISYNSRPPVVNLTSPDNINISNGTLWFSADINDDLNVTNATLRIWNLTAVIGTNFTILGNATIRANKSYVLPGEDNYIWNYEAWDSSSNSSTDPANHTLIYDLTRPNVTIISPANTTYTSFPLIFNISTSENVTANYSLDGGITNVSMTSNSTGTGYNATNLSLADGTYTFTVYAFDRVGLVNSTSRSVFSFVFNTTLTSCGVLDRDNTVYTLQNDVASVDTCFNLTGTNVTFNGAGKNIIFGNQSLAANKMGINATFGNNTFITNVTFMRGTAALSSNTRVAIALSKSDSSTIRDVSFFNVSSGATLINVTNSIISNTTLIDLSGAAYTLTYSTNNTILNMTNFNGGGIIVATFSANTTLTNIVTRNNTGGLSFSSVNGIVTNALVTNITGSAFTTGSDTINNTITNVTVLTAGLQSFLVSAAINSTFNNLTVARGFLIALSVSGTNLTFNNLLVYNTTSVGGCISLSTVENSTFTNVNTYNCTTGLALSAAKGNNFTNVVAHDGYDDAISITASSTNNTFSNVSIYNNLLNGIFISSASNYTVFNNLTISNVTAEAVYVNNSLGTVFNNLTIYNSSLSAFFIGTRSRATRLTNVTIVGTNVSAFDLNFTDNAYNETDFNDLIYAGNYSFGGPGGTMSLENNKFGFIVFLEPVNGTGTNFSNDIMIGNNSVTVLDANNRGLNKSANVTLYGIPSGMSDYVVLKDGVTCSSPVCNNLSVIGGGTNSFNVTGWSNYSIGASPPDTVAPVVTINYPGNITYDSVLDLPLAINVSLDENGSVIYSFDGGITNVSLNVTGTANRIGRNFYGTNTSLAAGNYRLSIYANDSVGNLNYTHSVSFTFAAREKVSLNATITNSTGGSLNASLYVFNQGTNTMIYNSTGPGQNVTIALNTTYTLVIDPLDISSIGEITFTNVNFSIASNSSVTRLFDVNEANNIGNFTTVFSVNPILTNFSNATVSFRATSNALFKCTNWTFSSQTCVGNWTILMKNLVVGNTYNITLNPGDPGYGIINITDAIHLDENYSFISNIYSNVSALDGVYSDVITTGEYVQVKFEEPLSSANDITVYPRIISGTPNISVFGYGNTTELARFTSLADNQSNQILLTNLTGYQDTFDLRVLGGSVQFDYIVDPSPFNYLLVQSGRITTTAVTVNATLGVPINTSSSFVLTSSATGNAVPTNALMMATITNSTRVKFDRFGTITHDIEWQVIDGSNFVVQNGTVTSPSGSETTNATLPIAINYSNTFVVLSSNLDTTTNAQTIRALWTARFLNTTMINFTRGATGTASTISWYAITWKGATVQNGTLNVTSGPATADLATEVNVSNSFIVTSLHTASTVGATIRVQAYFINSTRIAIYKNTTSGDVEAAYYVVSSPAITVQSSNVFLGNSVSQVNHTLSPLVNTSRTFSVASGSYNGSNNNYQNTYFTRQIGNSSTAAFSRGQSVETINITSYAISFTSVDSANPVPLLVSPFNGTIFASNTSTVSFNALFTDDLNVTNATFFLWNSTGVVNQTTTGSLSGTSASVNLSVTLPYNGTFFWNYRVSDEVGNVVFNSSNYTVTLNPAVAPYSPITICNTLSVPDMIYELQNNVETTGTCIIVNANNITIDGKDKIVYFGNSTGISPGTPSGILSSNGYNTTTIKNITIRRGFTNPLLGESRRSINLNNTNNITIINVNTSKTKTGIFINLAFNVTIANSTSFNNVDALVLSNFTGGYVSDLIIVNTSLNASINCVDACNSTTFNNLTLNSSAYGIYLANSYSNYISNVSISAATTDGIHILNGSDNIVVNYTGFNNTGDSIDFETTQNNTFANSVINQSAGSAISLGAGGAACNGLYVGNILQNVTIIGTNNSGYDLRFYIASCFNDTRLVDMPHIKNYTFNGTGNTIFVNNTRFGEIRFLKQINGSGTNFTSDVRLENNSATVVSSSNNGLNQSANVSLINLKTNYVGPQIYRDGVACPTTVCTNVTSLNAGYVVFNVTGWTNYSIIGASNIAPSTPTPAINSTKGLNRTAENLNCNSTINDTDGNLLNVSVIWYNGSSPALQFDYNNSNASGVNFLAVLRHENTTKGENWSCGMRLFDGTSPSAWANSTSLLILNTPPNSTLSTPTNYSLTTNRRVSLAWATSDDDGDSILNTTLNITCRHASGTSCSVYGNDDRLVSTGVGVVVYAIPSDLVYLADNGYMYNWTVQPTDSQAAQGAFAAPFTFNVSALVSISLPNSTIDFGSIAAGGTNDTSDDSPLPLLVQNDGNSFANVTIFSTDLWGTALNPTSNYQFKAANNTLENGSFTWGLSQVAYLNIPNTSVSTQICIAALNYTNATDTAEVDINVTVPNNEEAGYRNSSITFTATLGE